MINSQYFIVEAKDLVEEEDVDDSSNDAPTIERVDPQFPETYIPEINPNVGESLLPFRDDHFAADESRFIDATPPDTNLHVYESFLPVDEVLNGGEPVMVFSSNNEDLGNSQDEP